jgi:hypothetical protein
VSRCLTLLGREVTEKELIDSTLAKLWESEGGVCNGKSISLVVVGLLAILFDGPALSSFILSKSALPI